MYITHAWRSMYIDTSYTASYLTVKWKRWPWYILLSRYSYTEFEKIKKIKINFKATNRLKVAYVLSSEESLALAKYRSFRCITRN